MKTTKIIIKKIALVFTGILFILLVNAQNSIRSGSGNALRLNGLDNYLALNFQTNYTDEFSYSIAVKLISYPASGKFGMLLNKISYFAFTTEDFPFFSFIGPDGKVYAQFSYGGDYTGDVQLVSNNALELNRWYKITVVYKQNDHVFLYIDGILQQTLPVLKISGGVSYTNWSVGRATEVSSGQENSSYLNAEIDELSLWHVALTEAQIRAWMCKKITPAHPAYDQLVCYYRFDEVTGSTIVPDLKGIHTAYVAGSPTVSREWVTSGAALGDESAFSYAPLPSATLSHPQGESFTATVASGAPAGIHIYRVDTIPNYTSGISIGNNDRYYGVFINGDTSAQYNGIYNYSGNPSVGNESSLSLYKRADNSAATWQRVSAIQNIGGNTFSFTGENSEYMLSILPCENAAPTISAGGDTTFCQGGSVTLTSSRATSNLWSNGAITQSIVVNTSGNYTVTYTDSSGCVSPPSAIKIITVNPLPDTPAIALSGGTPTICQGDSIILTSADAASYLWSTGAVTQSIIVKTNGIFTLITANGNGCKSPSATITINVATAPLLQPAITVSGRTLTASAASTDQGVTGYRWYKNDTIIIGQTAQTYTVPDDESGSYRVAFTNNCGAGQASAAVLLTQSRQSQTIAFTPVSDKVYGDAPLKLAAVASSGLPLTFAIIAGPGSVSNDILTITGAGIISVKASQEGDENFTPAESSIDISVNKANASLTIGNLVQVYDGAGKIPLVNTNPLGLNNSISYDGTSNTPVNTGTYQVVATITSPNYQGNANAELIIQKADQLISLSVLPDKSFNDAPFTVQATASSGLPVSIGITTVPATGVASINGNTITILGAGAVTVNISQEGNENYNPAAVVTRSFNIVPPVSTDIEVVSLISPTGGCGLGSQANITAKIKNTGTTPVTGFPIYYTINGAAAITETINAAIPAGDELTYTFNIKGKFPTAGQSYEIKLYTSLAGDERLSNDTLTAMVARFAIPTAGVSKDTFICAGSQASLVASGGGVYAWTNGPATAINTVSPVSTSTYEVFITDPNGCSTTRKIVTVQVNPVPTANAGADQVMLKGSSVALSGNGSGTYLWSDGSTSAETVVSPIITSEYTLAVTNQFGCTTTDSVLVTVNFSALDVLPGLYNFSNVVVDSSAYTNITITNTGTFTETINSIDGLEGPFSTSFIVPFTLPAGTSVNIPIRFTPPATLIYQNVLTVNTSAGNFNISLRGNGANPAPAWTITPATYNFGKVEKATPISKNFVIKNTGNVPIRITTISSVNPRFVSTTNGIFNIPVGSSILLVVRFTPAAIISYTGTITIRTSRPDLNLKLLVAGSGYVNGNVPELQFLGRAPYNSTSGVTPPVGGPGLYTYSILYRHPDGIAPLPQFPKVGVDKNNDKDFIDAGEGVFSLVKEGNGNDWKNGVVFSFTTDLTVSELYGYRFFATDSLGNDALTSEYKNGPSVTREVLDLHIFADDIVFSKPNPAVNEAFTVTATIHNNSPYPATDVNVRFYYKDSIFLFDEILPFISGNSSESITKTLSFSPDGFYPIKVWIDSSNTLSEGNLLNNYASRPVIVGNFTVPGAIDITATAAPSTCSKGKVNFSGTANYRGLNLAGTPPVEGATVTLKIFTTEEQTISLHTDINGNWSYQYNPCAGDPDPASCNGPACGVPCNYTVEVTDYTLTSPLSQSSYTTPCIPCTREGVISHGGGVANCILTGQSFTHEVNISNFSIDFNGNKICAPVVYKDTIEVYVDGQLRFTHILDSIANCGSVSISDPVASLPEGDHIISYIHTWQTASGEVNEATVSTLFTVLSRTTDLVLKGVSKAGHKSFTFDDLNITCRASAPAHKIYLYDSLPGYTEKILLDSFSVSSIAENSQVILKYTNPDWQPGYHYLTLVTDVTNLVPELNESNNTLEAIFYVEEPDITISGLTISNTFLTPGALVNFSAQLMNTGAPVTSPFKIEFRVNGVPLGNKINIAALKTDESLLVISAPFPIPTNPCPIQVTAFADIDNEVVEFNEKNNGDTMIVGANVKAGRSCDDLLDNTGAGFFSEEDPAGTVFCAPYTTPRGVLTYLATTVRNTGNRDVQNIKIQFKKDSIVIGSDVIPSLKAGQKTETGFYYTFDVEGRFIINAIADYEKEICETNESDNIGNIHVDVRRSISDLQVLSQYIAPSNLNPNPGQEITIVSSIINVSDGVSAPAKVRFWVDDVQLGVDIPIDSLYPGQDTTVMATATYFSNIVGPKIIKVKADVANELTERREGNNEATRAIIVGAAPDFANSIHEAITVSPATFVTGDTVTISNYIRNYGGDAGSAWMRFYYRSQNGEKILIDSVLFNLESNDSMKVSKQWEIIEPFVQIITEIDHSYPPEFNDLNNVDSLLIGGVVPLTLLSFNGNIINQSAVLNWRTTNETNLRLFEVEVSIDGRSFKKIGTAPAINMAGNHTYQYTDTTFKSISGIAFYRLKMIDIDGHFRYSNIIVLANTPDFDLIKVYPNPAGNSINVQFQSSGNESYVIRVMDVMGRSYLQNKYLLQRGMNTFKLSLNNLASGIYVLLVQSENGVVQRLKFEKQ